MMSHIWQQEQDQSIDGIMDSFASENTFSFDGSMSVGTTTPSFSAASSVYDPTGPFTPRSGRSTPNNQSSSSTIDFDSSFSSHGTSFSFDHHASASPDRSYFPKPDKVDLGLQMQYGQPNTIPLTPSRRQSAGYGMEHLDYNTMLHVTLNSQCVPGMSSPHHHQHHHQQQHHHHHHNHHNPVEQYTLPQDLSSSPFGMPTPHRSLPHHSTPSNVQSIWSVTSESPIMMFGSESTPSTSPLGSMPLKRESSINHSPSPLRSPPVTSAAAAAAAAAYRQDSRRKLFAEVQRKTLALQKNQNDMEALRQLRSIQVNQDGAVLDCGAVKVRHVAPRRERCTYPDCTKTFKRKEHLKRHFKATHEKEVELYTCPATNCNHVFKERRDNFVSHLLLHKQGKSSRTPYNEKAAKMYDEMCLQSKSRKRVKTGSASSGSSSSSRL
ncbi:C2H2 type master regulator of conidiophore development brlA [Colletotrichum sidae]|uniref:C2H2 type master regulator of conidiophore development brlA n=1 Tax=Colletotrichum sidae TaxID=1347389 RepID=A0A4R8TE69_9PEZI|nr:C2H2 type master regulator of conidiophore development brlA [Colletotrichum sidae]